MGLPPLTTRVKALLALVVVALVIFLWNVPGPRRGPAAPSAPPALPAAVQAVLQQAARAPAKEAPSPEAERAMTERAALPWGRDPFTLDPKRLAGPGDKAGLGLHLSGIVWDGAASRAIINDTVVREGDVIADVTVVAIQRDRVILAKDGTPRTLRLGE